MKVNFGKIEIADIEGNVGNADFSKQLGNQLYMQGQDIEACELGRRIYFDGEVELTKNDVMNVKRAIAPWAYIARKAVCDAMETSVEQL